MRNKRALARLVLVLVCLGVAGLWLCGQKKPDLVVSSLTLKPTAPTTSTEVTFTVVVKNIGQEPAQATTGSHRLQTGGYGSSTFATDFNVPALGPAASFSIDFKMKVTAAGKATFVVQIKPKSVEVNNDNNKKELSFYVTAANPDLVVDAFTMSPTSPTTATEITFTGVVKNAGNAPAPPSKAQISFTPTLYSVPQLAPGAKHTIVYKIKLNKAQNYGPTFTVDKERTVNEGNETNNEKRLNFTVVQAK
ncbi:MAG: hypothetical protein KA419_16355 [Acidobacteria bacterium]|nr:hypothetical protein [Acidobacteriota bacterium]